MTEEYEALVQKTFNNRGILLQDQGWFPSLVKALDDNSFDYAIGLQNGLTIRFEGAEMINKHLVRLTGIQGHGTGTLFGTSEATFERGLEVRVKDIIWCADAPHGS